MARRDPAVTSGYRYYSPDLGRWLSRDPVGEHAFARVERMPDSILGYDPYRVSVFESKQRTGTTCLFVLNAPVHLVDPVGLKEYGPIWQPICNAAHYKDTYKGWYKTGKWGAASGNAERRMSRLFKKMLCVCRAQQTDKQDVEVCRRIRVWIRDCPLDVMTTKDDTVPSGEGWTLYSEYYEWQYLKTNRRRRSRERIFWGPLAATQAACTSVCKRWIDQGCPRFDIVK